MRWLADVILSLLAQVLDLPRCVYFAQFNSMLEPMVRINRIGAGPLVVGTSGFAGEDPQPLPGLLQQPTTAGLELRITKPSAAPRTVLMCALSPLPTGLPRFVTMVVRGRLLGLGPTELGDQWAITDVTRNSDNLGDSLFQAAGATHQIRHLSTDVPPEVFIAVGAGTGASGVSPTVDLVPPEIAYPRWIGRFFTLETDLDRNAGFGWSRLRTPGKTWPERSWSLSFSQVAGLGFGLAMVSGTGTMTAAIHEFSIYETRRRWWWNGAFSGLFYRWTRRVGPEVALGR